MKKHWKLYSLVALIFLCGLFIRLYRLENLMNFSMEQTWALVLAGDMVNNRQVTLIGTPYISRETATHHYFFQAGTYVYPIALLFFAFGGDPVPITAAFALINILSGLALFFVAKKFFGHVTAIYSFILFAFCFILVDYSRLIWHVPLLIPIAVGLIYLFLRYQKSRKPLDSFYLGLVLGIGWGIHVSLTVIGFCLLLYLLILSFKKHQPQLAPLYITGGLLGILPLIIFDIRLEFFNLRVLWEFFLGLFNNTNRDPFSITSYHLVHLLPLACLLGGWILARLHKAIRPVALLTIVFYIALNAPSWRLSAATPLGLPLNWNIAGMRKASAIIASDATGKFEVAQIIEGETRASTLRYFLNYIFDKHPLADTDYPQADSLYVVARADQDPVNYHVWEINSIKPVKTVQVWPIQSDIVLYKLAKAD